MVKVLVLNICLYLPSAVTGRVADDIQHMFLCLLLVSMVMLNNTVDTLFSNESWTAFECDKQAAHQSLFYVGIKVCGINL